MLSEYLAVSLGGTTDPSTSSLVISAKIRGLDEFVLSKKIAQARCWEEFCYEK